MQSKRLALALVAGVFFSGAAQATLFDRGSGLIYDDVLKITWLGDANYAKTSGYHADGEMTWSAANTWATNLVFHDSERGVDYSDWRLPKMIDTGSAGCNLSNNGTDCGYNVQTWQAGEPATTYSELAYMYFVNLGFTSFLSTTGSIQSDWGIFGLGNGTGLGERDNLGPNGAIDNLQSFNYWFGTTHVSNATSRAWHFETLYGRQNTTLQTNQLYAWAVRDGDVASAPVSNDVPEPSSMMLLGLALAGLGVARHRKAI